MAKKRSQSIEESVVFTLLKLVGMIFMLPFQLFKKSGHSGKQRLQPLDTDKVSERWSEIKELMQTPGSAHFRMAILHADTLLDFALKSIGMSGNTLGERLQSAEPHFSPEVYSAVWQAHKLRNRLAHEIESEVMSWEAREAIARFEQGLRELHALKDQ